VDCRRVIPVKLVKKVSQEVPNALVATPVNRVQVIMVHAKYVRKVSLVNPMIRRLILAHRASLATIKKIRAKRLVCHAYPEPIKIYQANTPVKNVLKIHPMTHRLLNFAKPVVLVDSPLRQAMHNALHASPVKRGHPVHHVIKEDIGQQMTTTLKRVLFAKQGNIKVQLVKPFVTRVFQVCTNPTKAAKNVFLALLVHIKMSRIKKVVKISRQVLLLLAVARLQ
jgi:hypothetical protein